MMGFSIRYFSKPFMKVTIKNIIFAKSIFSKQKRNFPWQDRIPSNRVHDKLRTTWYDPSWNPVYEKIANYEGHTIS